LCSGAAGGAGVAFDWAAAGRYRFSLDFLPNYHLPVGQERLSMRKKISWGFKVLTILGFILTLYFLVSFIDLLPQG